MKKLKIGLRVQNMLKDCLTLPDIITSTWNFSTYGHKGSKNLPQNLISIQTWFHSLSHFPPPENFGCERGHREYSYVWAILKYIPMLKNFVFGSFFNPTKVDRLIFLAESIGNFVQDHGKGKISSYPCIDVTPEHWHTLKIFCQEIVYPLRNQNA